MSWTAHLGLPVGWRAGVTVRIDDSDDEPDDGSGETPHEIDRDPPQDRPGQPGVPSRAESRRVAMEVNEKLPDVVTEVEHEKPPAAESESAVENTEEPDDEKACDDEADAK